MPRELHRPEPDRLRSDSGATLIELLITIVITGILFAALLAGLGGMTKTSALHRRQADVGAVIRSAAEAVKNASYVSCPAGSYPAYTAALAGVTLPGDVSTPVLVGVTKIDGTSCGAGDGGLQRVEIKATSKDGLTSETLWVVKRQ